MKKKKPIETNTTDPNITLVGEFRGSNIYIMGDRYKAKEFSEYMQLGFEAITFINDMNPNPITKTLSTKK